MRPTLVLLATIAAAVLLASGGALAVDQQCQANTPCIGTKQADTLTGSDGNDQIFGRGGNDLIRGLAGIDEPLSGGRGADEIRGGADSDEMLGGGGDDELVGQSGEDEIRAGNGDDKVFGGPNDDLLIFVNGDQDAGFQDEVFCGDGVEDTVTADANDIVHDDCEFVNR